MTKPVSTRILFTLCLLPVFLFSSCDQFEYDLNQSVNKVSDEWINYRNIDKLSGIPDMDSTITIALIGDTHIDYENTEKAVNAINAVPEVDFVIHTGDVTDNGILRQYEWSDEFLEKLHKPYFVAVGNHDLVGNGEDTYVQMYSKTDFSFTYGDVKFIFFNSNGREYNFNGHCPNTAFLFDEIHRQNHFKNIVLVSHVPFFDKDFDQSLRNKYLEVLNTNYPDKKIVASLNGHLHGGFDFTPGGTSVFHLAPGGIAKKRWYLIKIKNGNMTYERRDF